MWSTVTSTPTRLPHSRAQGSNHVSWAGTKWLHIRIDRAPDSGDAGSVNVPSGAALVGSTTPPGGSSPPPPHAASVPPSAARPVACRNRRLSNSMIRMMWLPRRHRLDRTSVNLGADDRERKGRHRYRADEFEASEQHMAACATTFLYCSLRSAAARRTGPWFAQHWCASHRLRPSALQRKRTASVRVRSYGARHGHRLDHTARRATRVALAGPRAPAGGRAHRRGGLLGNET